jgi:hypothetical protein
MDKRTNIQIVGLLQWCINITITLLDNIVEVEVTLRLTISQSVCLGIEYPCGISDQILFPVGMLLSEICGLVSIGRPHQSFCLLFKTQLVSVGLSVPHRKHITSPLRTQQVNAIYTFVMMVY